MKRPYVIGGIVIVVIIIIVGVYFAFTSDTKSPAPSTPANSTDDINSVIDNQIKEIANDVEKSAREGYISRREYYSSDSAQSVGEFVRIVLSNIMGKPIKAVIERDDVSGVLKVVMNGVDPKVFEPSLSVISNCVSEKIKTANGPREMPMHVYSCTNDYFSKNGKEFEDKIMPAILDMNKNAFYEYASPETQADYKRRGGLRNAHILCEWEHGTGSPELEGCVDSDPKTITWDKQKEIMEKIKEREIAEKEAEEAEEAEREKKLTASYKEYSN